ncbi:MAG: hypothetical protein QW524_00670 [Candidatus Woesearchaeota archaeon]
MVKIIIDTNFLFLPFEKKLDIFSILERSFHYKIAILSSTIQEIEAIKNDRTQKLKTRVNAKILLEIIKRKNIEVIETQEKYVDRAIIEIVSRDPKAYIVATGDKELRKKLQEIGILGLIYLRKNSVLEFYDLCQGTAKIL